MLTRLPILASRGDTGEHNINQKGNVTAKPTLYLPAFGHRTKSVPFLRWLLSKKQEDTLALLFIPASFSHPRLPINSTTPTHATERITLTVRSFQDQVLVLYLR